MGILLVAGEASGDLHGADLVRAIRERRPETSVSGIGGPALRQVGMETLIDSSRIAAMGLLEAADKFGAIRTAYREMAEILRTNPPELLVLVDFPEFNMRLAKVAKTNHVPTFYYISPQVWAGRRKRVHTMAERVDLLATVFPFEQEFYAKCGFTVEFVGHPLVDRVRPSLSKKETRARYGLDPKKPIIGLFPGSREQEVQRLLPPLVEAATILDEKYQFILAVAPTLEKKKIESALPKNSSKFQIVQGDTYNIMNATDLGLVASGTATLEMALTGTPMVIIYKMSYFTYGLARLFVHVPFIGMPNIIAGKQIVPELIQGAATPKKIAQEALRLLTNPEAYSLAQKGLHDVSKQLGSPGAAIRAAKLACDLLDRAQSENPI